MSSERVLSSCVHAAVSRRDAAFGIPDPGDISENPTAVEVERLRREWWPKLEHHAHVVVMNRQYARSRVVELIPTPNFQLPTPNSQLPTRNFQLPTPNFSVEIALRAPRALSSLGRKASESGFSAESARGVLPGSSKR